MNPQSQFCHNLSCPARGVTGQGNIVVHSRKEKRYRCKQCGCTFSATTGTPLFGLRTALDIVTVVLTLLVHGCPRQAIVEAFGLDERTVGEWQSRAGKHAQKVHEHIVEAGRVELVHVQADELWVKMVGKRAWLAMAMSVPTRLWLGGVVSHKRDRALIMNLMYRVRRAADDTWSHNLLVCVDGLRSYVTAVSRVFRVGLPRNGKTGRKRLVRPQGLLLGQVIKAYEKRRMVGATYRATLGTGQAITQALGVSGTGSTINTAYIERLNATFRSVLAPLVRRGRALLRNGTHLSEQIWLVGVAYNFCWDHHSLRQVALVGGQLRVQVRMQERTPAMAAGLTDHRWSLQELLTYQVPLPLWVSPKRRGRPPKRAFAQVTL